MNYREIIKSAILFGGYLFHRNRDSKVLFYHDVGLNYTKMGTPLEIIQVHINQIKKLGFDIVKDIDKKQNQVMICFDDGWSGLYDAKDYFVKENIFPTVFVAVDLIGTKGYMTAEQIKELADKGFVFQAHTWSHEDLTTFDDEGLHKELVGAKSELEKKLAIQIDALCFPKGLYNDQVVSVSIEAGYKKLYSSIWGGYYDLIGRGLICRNLVQDIPPFAIKYVLQGASPYLTKRYMKRHYKK